jgi:orotate phosphoribosyltransferase
MLSKKKIIDDLLKIEDIIIDEDMVLASRKLAKYYIDIKRSYGEPGFLSRYSNYIISTIGLEINNISCIVGSGHGGIPLAVALSDHLVMWDIKLCLIRSALKDHGRPAMFDGYPLERLNKKKKILIVDDVLTTGGSIEKLLRILPEGLKYDIFVICNRSGIREPKINGVVVKYILTPEELNIKSR